MVALWKLNDYCWFAILNLIKFNCELDKTDNEYKYADIVSLALAHEHFLDLLYDWKEDLYHSLRFQIKVIYLSNESCAKIDFIEIYEELETAKPKEKERIWLHYMDALTSNERLKSLRLLCKSELHYFDLKERIETILRICREKESMQTLALDLPRYSLERLEGFRNIRALYLNVRIDAEVLVEYCLSNPNLMSLAYKNIEMLGKLTDIVPYCSNLKELDFLCKADFDASEYVKFAELPKLTILKISLIGNSEIDTLSRLFNELERRGTRHLTYTIKKFDNFEDWCIKDSPFNFKISYFEDKTLYINCDIEMDAACFLFLANLTDVTEITFYGKHQDGTLRPLFEAIASNESTKLKSVQGSFNNEEILALVKIKTLSKLTITYLGERPIKFPTQLLARLEEIYIESQGSGSLAKLYRALAMQKSPKLFRTELFDCSIRSEELFELLKISTLEELILISSNIDTLRTYQGYKKLLKIENKDIPEPRIHYTAEQRENGIVESNQHKYLFLHLYSKQRKPLKNFKFESIYLHKRNNISNRINNRNIFKNVFDKRT